MAVDRVIVLDLGGVLLSDGTKTAFDVLGAKYGIEPQKLANLWHSELRIPAELGLASAEQTLERLAHAVSAPTADVEEQFLGEFSPIEEGIEFLRQTHASGVSVVLATNHVDEWISRWQRTFDWFALIDKVVCSAALGLRKPQRPFYEAVIDAAGGTTGFYFVDDAPENVAAANKAGLRGVRARRSWTSTLHMAS